MGASLPRRHGLISPHFTALLNNRMDRSAKSTAQTKEKGASFSANPLISYGAEGEN